VIVHVYKLYRHVLSLQIQFKNTIFRLKSLKKVGMGLIGAAPSRAPKSYIKETTYSVGF
jgi:hypothetical protein